MARYPVVSPATLILTNPGTGPLLTAIQELQQAENNFYNGRRNLVNSYPMKTSDITTSQIEALYDQYLGSEPWRYRARFDASGSTLKTGTDAETAYWVENWGDPPTGGTYPVTRYSAFLFDPERGASWVDLIGKFGYNNGFNRRGSTSSGSVTSGAGDGASTTYYTINEGFGVEPIAYNGRGGLSGFEAHMLKLVGDDYEDTVRPTLNTYNNRLNTYRNGNGTPTQATFSGNSATNAWEGYTGSSRGYNRPNELSAGLVRETRGTA